MNAVVASRIPALEWARHFDTVSICFSKGLGAPVGSMLLGERGFIERARRWRKVVGGGWRQAGLLAAMANHALDHHVARLADDHRRAGELAAALRALPGLQVDGPHTSMVFVSLPPGSEQEFFAHLASRRIRTFTRGNTLRLVLHLDVDDEGTQRAIAAFRDFYR
jgi:threonine aldolase